MDLSKLNEIDLASIDVNDLKKIGSAPAAVSRNTRKNTGCEDSNSLIR